MQNSDSAKIFKLQGHEKFFLRDGWISKAFNLISEQPNIFTSKDATDRFGIGSNMVKSLRYWMRAFGLTNETGTELSEIGKVIAKYDFYLEDIFSLWLMHSFISKNRSFATTWFIFFNRIDVFEIERDEIKDILFHELVKYTGNDKFSFKSLGSDVEVLLNMYSVSKNKSDPEDKAISPFNKLGLLKRIDGKYTKVSASMDLLPVDIVLFELSNCLHGNFSISIDNFIHGECSIEKIYNLSTVSSNMYLDKLDASGIIKVDRTAGLDMLYLIEKLDPLDIVENYYKNR